MGLDLGDVSGIIGLTPKLPYAGNSNADGITVTVHLIN